MKSLNTRNWSTPAIIASGIFVAISGVLMFFGIHNPIGLAHEWIGLIFAAAILLHVLNHWRAFNNYFSQKLALGVVGAIAIATSGLVFTSANQEGGDVKMRIIQSIENAPLAEVAALIDQQADDITARFKSAGFEVEATHQSINEIARKNSLEPKRLVMLAFQNGATKAP